MKRNLVNIPAGCSIEDFMLHRGKPPEYVTSVPKKELTLAELREAYFKSQEKKLEQTTLDGIRLHFDHLTRILGGKTVISLVQRTDLQKYVDKRSEEWIDPNVYRKARRAKQAEAQPKRKYKNPRPSKIEKPDKPKRHPSAATIKKEIISLRTAWNWGRRHLNVIEEFPGDGLDYAKIQETLPFMTWEEAERRIAAGDDPEKVWESVFQRPVEITELLEWVKGRPVSPWVMDDNYISRSCCLTKKCYHAVHPVPQQLTSGRTAVSVSWRQALPSGAVLRHTKAQPCLSTLLFHDLVRANRFGYR